MRIKIYGAGSAGNHLAFSCRQRNWQVTVVDSDPLSLERMKTKLFPQRYGYWDDSITLRGPNEADNSSYDAVLIATPPGSHLELACKELTGPRPPRALLLEKPLCRPHDPELPRFLAAAKASSTRIFVGFNLNFVPNTRKFIELAQAGGIGAIRRLDVEVRENVSYILGAHWWMKDISESYLGSTASGGGSLLEHSHAVALWAHLARALGLGDIERVSADFTFEEGPGGRYDSSASLLVRSNLGIAGSIHTDFHAKPAIKRAQLIGETGRLVWWGGRVPNVDSVELIREDYSQIFDFPKKRPDDFSPQSAFLEQALTLPTQPPENSLEFGLHVMAVINAAFLAAEAGTTRSLSAGNPNG
jgi:predicted dehydrogenase